MKTFLFFILMMLIFSLSYSQIQQVKPGLLKKYFAGKAKHVQQLILIEQQKTENQEKYDVKYYSLDLVPDPSAETLNGTVQIICEVLSASLDSIDLNFWDGMTITDIHLSAFSDKQLFYLRNNDILSIALDSTFFQKEQIALTIICIIIMPIP